MDDAALMARAMELAKRGRGRVEPNPMVGCVLAREGEIIAEGYHEYFGGPHAEPNALAKCDDPTGATAYVTLEPCCYTNKQTPPCVPQLISAKIARVVVACEDENPNVAGKGLAMLREAGIAVESGLMRDESRQMNAAYSKLVSHHRPYVTLKWAESADGKIAGPGGKRLTISGEKSLQLVQELRSKCDAIMVGINTVIADDPLLTARVNNPPRRAVRIVLDRSLRISTESQLVKTAGDWPLWIFCNQQTLAHKAKTVTALESTGAKVIGMDSLEGVLDEMGRQRMTHLLVEPGALLAESFVRGNLADRAWIFRSPMVVGSTDAPLATAIDYPETKSIALDRDRLTEYLNPGSPVFFLRKGSVDLPDPVR